MPHSGPELKIRMSLLSVLNFMEIKKKYFHFYTYGLSSPNVALEFRKCFLNAIYNYFNYTDLYFPGFLFQMLVLYICLYNLLTNAVQINKCNGFELIL